MNCLIYLYHGQSLGHVRRILSVARALSGHRLIRNLVLVSGGEFPYHFPDIQSFEVLQLPSLQPLPGTLFSGLTPSKLDLPLRKVQRMRANLLKTFVTDYRPDLLVTEFFPFGRARLSREIKVLMKTARSCSPRCRIVSSMRDILGFSTGKLTTIYKRNLTRVVNQFFDEIWIHGDPGLHRLETSFSLAVGKKCHYTGYVDTNERFEPSPISCGRLRILVSAGGGKDGMALSSLMLEALPQLERTSRVELSIVTGPYFDPGSLAKLEERVGAGSSVRFIRFFSDFRRQLSRAHISVSRCGYNTFLDIVQTGVRAVVIPRRVDPEQEIRARLLARSGAAVVLREGESGPRDLCRAILEVAGAGSHRMALDTAGALQVAGRVEQLFSGS